MASTFSNSKPNLLIQIIIIPFLLLHNVNSQNDPTPLAASETVTFTFSHFGEDDPNIVPLGDASVSSGALRLTKTDVVGNAVPFSVGRAVHVTPVHLWNKRNGNLADFTTDFSFVVNTKGASQFGDGFAFFIAPLDKVGIPKNSSGGYLGLFNPKTALDPTKNQILAIEFDTFTNEWDPDFPTQFPHVGIDVGSVRSKITVPWPSNFQPSNAVGHASINYNSESHALGVFVGYDGIGNITFFLNVDLRTVLPEYVRVGFSAATGELVETHDILSWSFDAAL